MPLATAPAPTAVTVNWLRLTWDSQGGRERGGPTDRRSEEQKGNEQNRNGPGWFPIPARSRFSSSRLDQAAASAGSADSSPAGTSFSVTLASSSMKSTTFSSNSGARRFSIAAGFFWKNSSTCRSWPG